MRFDDTLDTVLRATPSTPASRSAAWRQIVDLTARGRVADVDRAVAVLETLRDDVPLAVRSASARALLGARPAGALVVLLARDDIAVAAPVLRFADLPPAAWRALIPTLTPMARAILRHRRDLPLDAVHALEAFGPVDFVLPDDTIARPSPRPIGSDMVAPDPDPFVTVGDVARGLPMLARALPRGNDNDAPAPATDGTFRIADIVARIEAFQRSDAPPPAPPVRATAPDRFRFETDAAGTIRWTDIDLSGAVLGLSLKRPAKPGEAGVDGGVAGAWAARDAVRDGRMVLAAGTPVGGTWLVTAAAAFDPATVRYIGHRGTARRPRAHEGAALPFADAMRQLVHELRTPTTALSGFSEMIAAEMLGPVPDHYRAQALAIHDDSRALLGAIDDIDTAARAATGALSTTPETIALSDMLGIVGRDLAPLAAERGSDLSIAASTAVVRTDASILHRLLGRLIGTMLGAAGRGETIGVRIDDTAGGNRVTVVVTRPSALDAYVGDQLYAIDAESCPVSLLGTAFALRLARNLARHLGGGLTIGIGDLTLHLPTVTVRSMDQASLS